MCPTPLVPKGPARSTLLLILHGRYNTGSVAPVDRGRQVLNVDLGQLSGTETRGVTRGLVQTLELGHVLLVQIRELVDGSEPRFLARSVLFIDGTDAGQILVENVLAHLEGHGRGVHLLKLGHILLKVVAFQVCVGKKKKNWSTKMKNHEQHTRLRRNQRQKHTTNDIQTYTRNVLRG